MNYKSLLKKTNILAACIALFLFCTGNLQAQIIGLTKVYADGSYAGSGQQGHTTGPGHLMGGVGSFKAGVVNYTGPMAIKTDVSGYAVAGSTTYFNHTCEVLHSVNGNRPLFNTGKVIELNDGSGYAAAYSFTVADNTSPTGLWAGIMFIVYGSNGYPVAYYSFTFDPNIYRPNNVKIAGIYQLANTTPPVTERFVIAAEVADGEDKRVFVLPVDEAGMTFWGGGKLYDLMYLTQHVDEIPHGIIQSPYDNDIYVVGEIGIAGQPWNTHDGWIMRLDLGSGNVSGANVYDLGQYDALTGIKLCTDPASPGFVFSGHSHDIPGTRGKIWAMKTDGNFNVQWSNLYDDVNAPNNVYKAWDITETNYNNAYEYVVAGERNTGARDGVILQVDANGNPVNSGMYAMSIVNFYGDDEYAVGADATAQMGRTAYCYHNDGSVVNTLLDYQCFSQPTDVSATNAQPNVNNLIVGFQTPPWTVPLYINDVKDNNDQLLCLGEVSQGHKMKDNVFSTKKPFGRPAVPDTGTTGIAQVQRINGMSIYPNPTSGSLKIEINGAANAEVLIQSLQGVLVGKATKQGDGIYTFDASPLAAGVYLVEIRTETGLQVSRFIKQ